MKTFNEFLTENLGNMRGVLPLWFYKKHADTFWLTTRSLATKITREQMIARLREPPRDALLVTVDDAGKEVTVFKFASISSWEMFRHTEKTPNLERIRFPLKQVDDFLKGEPNAILKNIFSIETNEDAERKLITSRSTRSFERFYHDPRKNVSRKYFEMLINDLNKPIDRASAEDLLADIEDSKRNYATERLIRRTNGDIKYYILRSGDTGKVQSIIDGLNGNYVSVDAVNTVVKYYKYLYKVALIK